MKQETSKVVFLEATNLLFAFLFRPTTLARSLLPNMKLIWAWIFGFLAVFQPSCQLALGWDYEGHRLVNQLALASLPTNFPGFVRNPELAERVAFLAGEPDRWRNTADLPLKHLNG